MIDLNKAKEAFASYVRQYSPCDEQIQLKIRHTYEVVRIAHDIAREVVQEEEQVRLAELIALLHDIGRFEQIRRYHTFLDAKSVNHAELGVSILKEGLLRTFVEEDTYDDIILQAIANHNRYQIEDGLDPLTLIHAKIIRDADKTDIFRVNLMEDDELLYLCTREELCKDTISEDVYTAFKQNQSILASTRKTHLDVLVSHIALLFDYNYATGLRIVKENHYVEQILDPYHFEDPQTAVRMQNIRERALRYLEEHS